MESRFNLQGLDMTPVMQLAESWSRRWALHSLPAFDASAPNALRNNHLWNWCFLAVQVIALGMLAYSSQEDCGRLIIPRALSSGVAVYGWIDLSLCIARKTFLLHLRLPGGSDESNIGSAWLMFTSLTVVYANLYIMASLAGVEFLGDINGAAAAIALSMSTMTTVGYGHYAPVGGIAVTLCFLQAVSGLALISCIVAAAVSNALGQPRHQEQPSTPTISKADTRRAWVPWTVLAFIMFPTAVAMMLLPCAP
jgi:Ion channel